jgi:broad specificity phosphatase PhoE
VNKDLYQRVPDSKIPLTGKGMRQGTSAGEMIRTLIGDEKARFFHSPYLRTRQTLLAILKAFDGQEVGITSEPRLREQDFGNFQDREEMTRVYEDRQKFGRFYFRFPNGEAGTDVFDRVCDFWGTLYRYMDGENRNPRNPSLSDQPTENIVIVTHGLLMRIFCMCYFKWTVREFEQVWNPSNCEIWVLERETKRGDRYQLLGRWRASPKTGEGLLTPIKFGISKNEPLYEHMKTPQNTRYYVAGTEFEGSSELAHLALADEVKESLEICLGQDCELDLTYAYATYSDHVSNR